MEFILDLPEETYEALQKYAVVKHHTDMQEAAIYLLNHDLLTFYAGISYQLDKQLGKLK